MTSTNDSEPSAKQVREVVIPIQYFVAMLGGYVLAFGLGWRAGQSISPASRDLESAIQKRNEALRMAQSEVEKVDRIGEALKALFQAEVEMVPILDKLKESVRAMYESGQAAVVAAREAPEGPESPAAIEFEKTKSLFIGRIDTARQAFDKISDRTTATLELINVEYVHGAIIDPMRTTVNSEE